MSSRRAHTPPTSDPASPSLLQFYQALLKHYGPQRWWPAETPFEVVVGAVLTQNTAWMNVQQAIANLKAAGQLNVEAIYRLSERDLSALIRPSGTHRVKARRLKAVVAWLWEEHRGDFRTALGGDMNEARERLLAIHGVGPETADAILLYAGGRRSFVVDAYTRRVLRRHGRIKGHEPYGVVRDLLMAELPRSLNLYQEAHALLVAVAKDRCRAVARCQGCPLASWPHDESA